MIPSVLAVSVQARTIGGRARSTAAQAPFDMPFVAATVLVADSGVDFEALPTVGTCKAIISLYGAVLPAAERAANDPALMREACFIDRNNG